MVYPAPAFHLDRFPVPSEMMIALDSEISIVLVIVPMTTDTGCRQDPLIVYLRQ
jgi:hypothetical protein